MMDSLKLLLLSLLLFAAGAGAAQEAERENDYPTQARVEYVFDCMNGLGGINYTTMYKCVCSIDEIASMIPYAEFVTMDTFFRGQSAAGERPEILREGDLAESSRTHFEEVKRQAAKSCFIEVTAEGEEEEEGE